MCIKQGHQLSIYAVFETQRLTNILLRLCNKNF